MSNYITCGTTACLPQQGSCFVATNHNPNAGIEYSRRNKCSLISLAVTELILGICLIGIGISAIPVCNSTRGCGWPEYDYYYYFYGIWTTMGTNIWGGALVILIASFCFAHACCPSKCTIGANLGLSSVGIFLGLGLMGVEITAAIVSWQSVTLIILHSIAATFYFILFILFIVNTSRAGMALGCCRGCCDGCCCEPYGQQEIVSVIPANQSHVVTLSNGQTVLLQGHPHVVPAPSYSVNPPQGSAVTLAVPNPNVPGQTTAPAMGSINPSYVTDIPPKV